MMFVTEINSVTSPGRASSCDVVVTHPFRGVTTSQTAPVVGGSCELGDCAQGALRYVAELGWAVLPVHAPVGQACTCGRACERIGKHPATGGGVKDATSDPAQIAAWFEPARLINLGVATGAPSGFWCLDVDGADGMHTMAELERRHGPLPVTVTGCTGGGGLHLLWRLPERQAIGCRVGVAPGVDVRGNDGYIVAPPSMHTSGRRYRWHPERGTHQVELGEAPQWLVDLALGRGRTTTGGGTSATLGALLRRPCPEGGRNNTCARLAGHLLDHGIHPEAATEILIAWSARRCEPPMTDREIRRTVLSIHRRHRRRASA